MIAGIGSDIVEIERIAHLMQKFNDKFLKKFFTADEILSAKKKSASKINFYAKRFAAKEAFSKACGLGIGRGINFLDIEIFNNELGKPFIRILNNKEEFLQKYLGCKKFSIHLSLSDERKIAHATVIIEKIDN